MGTIVVSEFVTLDGVMEAPGGEATHRHTGWVGDLFDTLEWNNSTLLRGDVVEAVTQLKAQVDGIVLVAGSCTLVHTLIEHDLVDELRLMVFPVAIGSGLRVFPQTEKKTALRLTHSEMLDEGVQVNHYAPA